MNLSNSNLVMQAPFNPGRKMVQTISWQVNDPIVHYMTEHLRDVTNAVATVFVRPALAAFVGLNVSNINARYRPWGGNPLRSGHPNDFNRGVKDPGMFLSDNWNFPTNLLAEPSLLGRVHRGTPWQTIYLKSEVADRFSWDLQFPEFRSHPTSDWQTVSKVLPILVTNDVRTLISVNSPSLNAWRGVLDGITVLSNLAPEPFGRDPQFVSYTMQSNSPQARLIAKAVQGNRMGRPREYFPRVGDVLFTPELSVTSPWLNTSTSDDLMFGLTDEAYERIPEQLLPQLRSEPVIRVRRQPGQTEIIVEAYAGYSYRLNASADLHTWRTVAEVNATEPVFVVIDSAADSSNFYRATMLP